MQPRASRDHPRRRLAQRRLVWSSGALALLVIVALAVADGAHAQTGVDEPVVARVTVKTPAEVERFMALGLDLLETRDGDDLFIVTTSAELDRLRANGWTIRVDTEHTTRLRQQQEEQRQRSAPSGPRAELFFGGYRTVSEIRAFVEDRAAQYPDLVELSVYGESWERATGGAGAGHDLHALRLSNRQRTGPKPTMFLMAAIHARELSTAELAMRFVDHLLEGYGVDADATWLLDEHLIVVVPLVNPDGRVLAEQGYLQRKNTNTSYGNCNVPNIGVDLNRNAPFKWGTVDSPSLSPCAQTYPGPVAVSEPEVTALAALVRSLFADQRGPGDSDPSPASATGILITLHSYGNLVMWPWGWTSTPAPNAASLAAIGRKLAGYNGFTPQQSIQLYPTSGTTDDWAYGELGIASFVFEVGPSSGTCGGFFPPFSCLDGNTGGSFWPRNLPALLYAARLARAPYQLVQGPTVEAATATARPDGRVDVQARLDSRTNSGQAISAAELYVDTPPWGGGAPTALGAVDGSFDTTVELATAPTAPLTARHLVLVRARDASGAWGPVRGVFTPDPACPASLSPAQASVPTDGATDVAAVSVPDGCGWSAATVATWIDVQTPSGVGSGSVTYTVAANTGATPRTAIIAIGGTAFTVSQAAQAPADLRSRQVSAPPAVAEPGTGWSVTETTENIGTVIAGASTTRFYLSIDTAKGPGDTLLTGTRSVPSLAGGTASTGTITVKIPASVPLGRYYLLACADDTGRVTEQNESNNCVASATPVDVTRPDLVATEVGNPPAVAARGARFSVTDTVANQGGIAVRSSVSRYYLSANPEKGAGDTLLKGTRSVPALAPGATSTKAATLTVPANAPVGGFYLLACADDTELVSESVEANNCIASTAKVTVSRPDLVETMVSPPPASASRGGSFLVTDTVNNQGQVGSRSSVIRYYFSTDASRSAGDRLLTGSRSVRALAAGQSSSGTIRVTIPTATPLGSYFLLACADASDVVEEENEANNCLAATGQVAVSP